MSNAAAVYLGGAVTNLLCFGQEKTSLIFSKESKFL